MNYQQFEKIFSINKLLLYCSNIHIMKSYATYDNKYQNKLGLSWAKLSPSWDWTVINIYKIELIIKIEWPV